jgi:AraC-like DNA-binding protein
LSIVVILTNFRDSSIPEGFLGSGFNTAILKNFINVWRSPFNMPPKFLLECLSRSEIVYHIKNFLRDLCRINLSLLDTNGNYFTLSDSQKTTTAPNSSVPFRKKPCGIKNCRMSSHCSLEKLRCVTRTALTRQPENFTCPMGYANIYVPIVVNDEVVSFLYIVGMGSLKLNALQIKSISLFLKKITDTMVKDELTTFRNLKSSPLTPRQRLVHSILNDINENYHKPDLSLKDVSERNAVSYHHLSRIFKKEFKTSFSKYRNKVRMEVASKLLRNRSLSVGQISYMCGFDDPGYFCKVFKLTFGCPPLDFHQK